MDDPSHSKRPTGFSGVCEHKNSTKKITWNQTAEDAFNKFKSALTTALISPRSKQTIHRRGGCLGMRGGGCHITPWHTSPENSPLLSRPDIGNHELLAVKVTLEEWQHWLEDVAHPFMF